MKVSKAERKDWAREVFRGASGFILPSFTPDFSALDEEGIRLDVRNAIAQGYFGTTAVPIGCTRDEGQQLLRIVLDEAGDRIEVSGNAAGATLEEAIFSAQESERLGCSNFLLSLPRHLRTVDELWNYTRQIVDATDMAVCLYFTGDQSFRHLDPGNVPFDVWGRLAELPNVVGAKLTQTMDAVTALRCAEQLGDMVMLGPVNIEIAPMMAKLCPIQWTGIWSVDAIQAPDHQFVVELMDLLRQDRIGEAESCFYTCQPLTSLFWDIQAPLLRHGVHPWAHIKYYSYLVGGNGGLLREPPATTGHESFPAIDSTARQLIRDTYAKVGISVSDDDVEAQIGRSALARGVSPSDMAANGTFIQQ